MTKPQRVAVQCVTAGVGQGGPYVTVHISRDVDLKRELFSLTMDREQVVALANTLDAKIKWLDAAPKPT